MKKILICIVSVMTLLFLSCQNSVDSDSGKKDATPASSGTEETKPGIEDVEDDSARTLISLGETTEEIDSVTYTVKKYAEVYVEDPYFYTYYKIYYSNEKLRRVYKYYHNFSCDMDYKYEDFEEHVCGALDGRRIHEINTYYENGKIESHYEDKYDNGDLWGWETVYDSDGKRIVSKNLLNDFVYSETEYFSNGNEKANIDFYEGKVQSFKIYYQSGNLHYRYDGTKLYTYDDGETGLKSEESLSQENAEAKYKELKNQL